MKKAYLLIILPVLLFSLVSANVKSLSVLTPELFGNGTAYIFQSRGMVIGFISAWGGWMIYGKTNDCRITQILGVPIGGAEAPIACFMSFKKANRFDGWIDFRGHRRKFCGGDVFPRKCYGE